MEKKHRFFIYDRQEVGILLLLGVMVAVFAFTLGIHLGKRALSKQETPAPFASSEAVAPVAETTPEKKIEDQVRADSSPAPSGPGDDTLNSALHDEVARTGIKIDAPRQIQLPKDTVAEKPAAVEKPQEAPAPTPVEEVPAPVVVAKYSLQVGSFPTAEEAQTRAQTLASSGLKTVIHEAEVQGIGHRFRLFVGAFTNKEQAIKAGQKYRSRGLIESFILANSVAGVPQ